MGIQNIPIEDLPHLYISGLNISVASTTVIAVAPGQARDSNDNIDMVYADPLFIDSGVVGVNGLDQGTLAASTNYVVYLIADSTNNNLPAGLLTLQSNAFPLLPFGYDSYRMLGFVTTDGATAFLAASVLNAAFEKGYYLQPPASELAGGNAIVFTAIDLSPSIPTTVAPFVIAILVVTFIPANAGDIAQFRPTGSTATTGLVTITGREAGIAQTETVVVNCGVSGGQPSIDYIVSDAGDSLSVLVSGYYVTLE